MNYETLNLEHQGHLRVITLNRPDDANGINAKMAAELLAVARDCAAEPTVKVVLLTANGRFFCAGGDVKEFADAGAGAARHIRSLADNLHLAVTTFAQMDALLVVAVNGMAAGAGFSLAMGGDIVLASDAAAFTLAYTAIGLSPDGGASYLLPRLVGLRRAQELIYTNRKLSAQEAMDWGLVTRVVPAAELASQALQVARLLCDGSRPAFASAKRLLTCSFDHCLETQLELEAKSIAACAGGPEGREGVLAFTQKRRPSFG